MLVSRGSEKRPTPMRKIRSAMGGGRGRGNDHTHANGVIWKREGRKDSTWGESLIDDWKGGWLKAGLHAGGGLESLRTNLGIVTRGESPERWEDQQNRETAVLVRGIRDKFQRKYGFQIKV